MKMLENENYLNALEQCKHLAELTMQRTNLEEKKAECEKILEKHNSLVLGDYFSIGLWFVGCYLIMWVILLIPSSLILWSGLPESIMVILAGIKEIYALYNSFRAATYYETYARKLYEEEGVGLGGLGVVSRLWASVLLSITNDNTWDLKDYFNSVKEEQNQAAEFLKEIEDRKLNITRELAEEYTKLDMKSAKGELELPREYWTLASKLEELYQKEGANTLQKGLAYLKMK